MIEGARERVLSFWRRSLNAEWIKRKIDQRVEARLDELRQAIGFQHNEIVRLIEVRAMIGLEEAKRADAEESGVLRRLVEVRAQIAEDEAKSYAEQQLEARLDQLRQTLGAQHNGTVRLIEERAMIGLEEAKRACADETGGLRKFVEVRAQIAEDEAKGYADQQMEVRLDQLRQTLGAQHDDIVRLIEERAMIGLEEAKRAHADETGGLRKFVEVRAQIAEDQAKGYADQRVEARLDQLRQTLGAQHDDIVRLIEERAMIGLEEANRTYADETRGLRRLVEVRAKIAEDEAKCYADRRVEARLDQLHRALDAQQQDAVRLIEERAMIGLEEAKRAYADETGGLRRLVEVRAQIAEDEAKCYADQQMEARLDQLRQTLGAQHNDIFRLIEVRSMIGLEEAKRAYADETGGLCKLVEARAQIAEDAAKCYADQRLEARLHQLCKTLGVQHNDIVRLIEVRAMFGLEEAKRTYADETGELRKLVEARAQIAEDEAKCHENQPLEARLDQLHQALGAQHHDLVRLIEERAMIGLEEAKRAYADETGGLRKLVEVRAQIAGDEAKCYADQGLGALSQSLGAVGRVVVTASKQVSALQAELNDIDDELRSAQQENAQRLEIAHDLTANRLNMVPEIVTARLQPLKAMLADLQKRVSDVREADLVRLEAVERDVSSALASNDDHQERDEFLSRFQSIEGELARIVSDYNTQLRNAEHRIDFVRSETMYEMQASLYRSSGQASPTRTVARVINSAKVESMRSTGLRLNLGAGHLQLDDYLNVDGRALPGIDIVADATAIPFDECELAEIRSSHLVEHFSSHILERVVLPHWAALLQPGGVLTTIAPDGEAMVRALNDGEMEFEDFREVLFGGQDYDGDFHFNLITPKSFFETLQRAGFNDISEDYVGKRNGKCFEFKITARKA
ncbi:hypothetical protein GCM10008023_21320 [Sphingomonas glacialis]|uniref:Methyltransferase domain-containing protein n=1 Tax=Sphingomonas glacialis TaxID=658225 RepID=A0ABQ3LI59_9SPHN|nr:hypothetical protein [Sphingomonas glacialis]GHH16837.1 hypothetical protein GCM10008023_21320 [Sphingomonas glacialis]